jgi:hypothetical protein
MAQKSGFFEAVLVEGIYDRAYDAGDISDRFADCFSNGVIIPGGGILGDQLEVSKVVDTMKTSIDIGKALINGYTYEVYTDAIEVTHDTADPSNPRIDRIVLELNLTEAYRSIRAAIVKGTPAGSPSAPSLTRTSTVYQISLAKIQIGAGVSTLNAATLTDERSDDTVCGIANVALGISAPSGNDAITLNVDDTDFDLLTSTNQQDLDNEIDVLLYSNLVPPTASAASRAITITVPPQTYVDGQEINFYLSSDIASGAAITLTISNGTTNIFTALNIKDYDGNNLTLLSKGYIKVYYQDDATDFFVYAPSGGALKSAQQITFAWNDTTTTKDITISSVDTNSSIIDGEVSLNGGIGADYCCFTAEFLNATTVRCTRVTGTNFGVSTSFVINIEEYNSVKSKQTGLTAINVSPKDITVSSYDSVKTILKYTVKSTSTSQTYRFKTTGLKQSSTSIRVNEDTAKTIYWQLLEFK